MRARSLLLMVWTVLWFGVIAPGHQRGVIRTPGTEGPGAVGCEQQAATSCCTKPPGASGDADDSAPGDEDPARRCAICYLNGVLDAPPPVSFVPAVSLAAIVADAAAPLAPPLAPRHSPRLGRAPPTIL